jgi:cation:H+ antiporter
MRLVLNLLLLAGGLALVVSGSEVMIGSVTTLCRRYDVPESVMAVTLVALGTSLPELVTALTAVAKGHPALLVGNVIGADILNVLFVVGASALAVPLRVDAHFFWLDLPFMMTALVLLRVYIWLPGRTFKRWQGVPLLLLYVAFCVMVIRLGTL